MGEDHRSSDGNHSTGLAGKQLGER